MIRAEKWALRANKVQMCILSCYVGEHVYIYGTTALKRGERWSDEEYVKRGTPESLSHNNEDKETWLMKVVIKFVMTTEEDGQGLKSELTVVRKVKSEKTNSRYDPTEFFLDQP